MSQNHAWVKDSLKVQEKTEGRQMHKYTHIHTPNE